MEGSQSVYKRRALKRWNGMTSSQCAISSFMKTTVEI
jgi:hypothetical protein